MNEQGKIDLSCCGNINVWYDLYGYFPNPGGITGLCFQTKGDKTTVTCAKCGKLLAVMLNDIQFFNVSHIAFE